MSGYDGPSASPPAHGAAVSARTLPSSMTPYDSRLPCLNRHVLMVSGLLSPSTSAMS